MQLISFYDSDPIKAKGASVVQLPLERADEFTFSNEPTIAKVVYVRHARIEARVGPTPGSWTRGVITRRSAA